MTKHEFRIRIRIENALGKIQAAQGLINEAMQELSSIRGAAPAYSAGHKLYDRIHAYWYRVASLRNRASKLSLDYEPEGP